MNKFLGRVFIEGEIKLLTGLHIGASKEIGEIGGMDNPVIKTAKGVPYIPGSSLKGKIRCLLERRRGFNSKNNTGDPCGCGDCEICLLFGAHSSENKTITRLAIRDSYLDEDTFKKEFKDHFEEEGYTEEKNENIIDRINGTAKHPRTIERVPAGARFHFKSTISFYEGDNIKNLIETYIEGLRLLEDDYLGGSGTRGYGNIRFENLRFSVKNIEKYLTDNSRDPLLEAEDLGKVNINDLSQKIENNLVKGNKK